MLSGKLGGLAQVRPKLLFVAMLLVTVVLAACGGDESEQPPETPTPATVPTATAGLPAPTPTVQPASATPTVQPGSATPEAIDTSDWLTHASPLGFTIRYPSTWLLVEFPVIISPDASGRAPTPPPVHAKIFNERSQEVAALRGPGAIGEGSESGEAWVEILPLVSPPNFDPDALLSLCGVGDEAVQTRLSVQGSQVDLAGQPAVRCLQEGPHPISDIPGRLTMYFFGVPSGTVVMLGGQATDGDQGTHALLEAILTTVSFDAGAMVEP